MSEYLMGRKKPSDLEKAAIQAAERKHELEVGEERLKELNKELFEPWKTVSIHEEPFHVKFTIRESSLHLWTTEHVVEPMSLRYFEKGKEFLQSRNDCTKELLKNWEETDGLKDKYNNAGKKAQEKIDKCLLKAYPNLQGLESRRVSNQDCYVITNIIALIWFVLKEGFLKDGRVNWDSVLLEEKMEEDLWILTSASYRAWRVFIQSRTKTDANELYFKETIENLILAISKDLKQLDNLHKKLSEDLEAFRKKMNGLTIDIDLHKLN